MQLVIGVLQWNVLDLGTWTSIPFWTNRFSCRLLEIFFGVWAFCLWCSCSSAVTCQGQKGALHNEKTGGAVFNMASRDLQAGMGHHVMCYFVGTVRVNHSTSMHLCAIQLIFYYMLLFLSWKVHRQLSFVVAMSLWLKNNWKTGAMEESHTKLEALIRN